MNIFYQAAKNKFVAFLILSGILTLLLSLSLDAFTTGKGGIGPAQILIAILGAALALLGIGLMLAQRESDPAVTTSFRLAQIPSLPNIVWIVLGAFFVYLVFVIAPMFLNPEHSMGYFNKYLPAHIPIGNDLADILDSIRTWFAEGTAKLYYPPLVTVLLSPLLLVSYPLNYYILTIVTLVSYFILALLIPILITGKRDRSVILFLFGISALAYGLQFELERGQFHIIAMTLCVLAVYIFHRHRRYRFFAYVLFCMAVQFKIYPAIFFVFFVDDWRDWKANLRRFVGLGVANFLLLFLLGFSYFSKFLMHLQATNVNTSELWIGNHSIKSFLYYVSTSTTQPVTERSLAWVGENIGLLSGLFMAYFAICFGIVWLNTYRRNTGDIDPMLLMACVIGGLIIPVLNHDYTLPLLTAPFALMSSVPYGGTLRKRITVVVMLFISSTAYTLTLVPYLHKPAYLKNSFPLLILLLTITTVLSFLREDEPSPVNTSE